MGVVYEAEDSRLGRRVALKFLPESLASDARALERFQREARTTSLLSHPNICAIYDIAEHKGRPYLVMELLEGESLTQHIHGEPLPNDELIELGIQIAGALQAAHAQGIIHRDIKPGNIFVTQRGQAKILDFGLAKLAAPQVSAPQFVREPVGPSGEPVSSDSNDANEEGLTSMGVIAGTSSYMSPEQVRNEELDPRSDLFSCGVVLYEMATGKRPFTENNNVLTLAAILEKKPVSPLTLNSALPPEFEAVTGKALEKDRDKRYQSAIDLEHDLQELKRHAYAAQSAPVGRLSKLAEHARVFRRASARTTYIALAIAAVMVMLLTVTAVWWAKHGRLPFTSVSPSVAVLPFQSMAPGDISSDYLRVALADEISTILTYTPSLEVRPVSSTRRYIGITDPQQAGKELRVSTIVTGHYVRQGAKLTITVEAIDVRTNRLLWQGSMTAPANDLILMQKQLAMDLRQGLIPVLAGRASSIETATKPKNSEAYDLYLRSAAVPHDPEPNREAIAMLERSVGLDPGYAPTWDALGLRYYYDSQYGGGGERAFDRASAAYARAVTLDPNYVVASGHLARARAERGEVAEAYKHAHELVKRRPDNSQAHFTLAYVLRYAGLLDEATRECDRSLQLDPGSYLLRSCAFAFFELGQNERALDYLNLDAGSEWSSNVKPAVLLRDGQTDAAREAARNMSNHATWFGRILLACLEDRPASEMNKLVLDSETALMAQRDAEFRYHQGAIMAYCGQMDVAVRLLKSAIQQNYCSAQALEKDPALRGLRNRPEYEALLTAGKECQDRFRRATAGE